LVPGVPDAKEGAPLNRSVALTSTVKKSEPVPGMPPELLVTVTVYGPGAAPVATVKDAVILPELMLQVGAGLPANNVPDADSMQLKSWPGKPTPETVTLVFCGPSEGEKNMAGATGDVTVKVAEALSPSDPFTVTRKDFPA
jgi:hypothetical protein